MFRLLRTVFYCSLPLFAACATNISTDITTFRTAQLGLIPGTVEIRPREQSSAASLEFEYYAERLAQKLSVLGMKRVGSKADYVAYLDYGIERQQAEQRGSTQVHAYHASPMLWGHYGLGTLVLTDGRRDRFEFKRIVYLAINKAEASSDKKDSSEKLIEVTAISVGRCGQFIKVYDEMLQAIFTNINRQGGSVERVLVPAGESC